MDMGQRDVKQHKSGRGVSDLTRPRKRWKVAGRFWRVVKGTSPPAALRTAATFVSLSPTGLRRNPSNY